MSGKRLWLGCCSRETRRSPRGSLPPSLASLTKVTARCACAALAAPSCRAWCLDRSVSGSTEPPHAHPRPTDRTTGDRSGVQAPVRAPGHPRTSSWDGRRTGARGSCAGDAPLLPPGRYRTNRRARSGVQQATNRLRRRWERGPVPAAWRPWPPRPTSRAARESLAPRVGDRRPARGRRVPGV